MPRALLLHNAKAGRRDHSSEDLAKHLAEAGFDVTHVQKGDDELAAALRKKVALIVVAGGDGTVAALKPHLGIIRAPITVLPLGTSNNIARSLGLKGSARRLVAGLATSTEGKLDIGIATGPFGTRSFLEAVGFGAIARLTGQKFNAPSPKEKLKLIWTTLAHDILEAKPIGFGIEVDGVPLPDDVVFAEFTSLSLVGPRLPLARKADPGDRQLDVVTLRSGQRDAFAGWLLAGARGTAPVDRRRAGLITADWTSGAMRIDDKSWPEPEERGRVAIGVAAEGLRVRIP